MPITDQDILSLVRENDDVISQKLSELTTEDLTKLKETLAKPIRLSYSQRMLARAFGIGIDAEQKRFSRLTEQILSSRISQQ
jgi:hypothetical protein